MNIEMIMEAELRAAVAEAKCEDMATQMDVAKVECESRVSACEAKCEDLKNALHQDQLANTALATRLEAERSERARSDAVFKQLLELASVPEDTMEWDFKVRRDGASQMTGVTAVPKKTINQH